ncbi:MAG: flippase-like domain-containing protein [Saprospiraceae bacterium]|nr:flippase-like domain-containing protein [Saprospiraceae bacterium]
MNIRLFMFGKRLKYVIIALAVMFLILFIKALDLRLLYTQLMSMGWRIWAVICVSGMAYFFGTLGWYYSFAPQFRKINLGKLFMVRMVGESLAVSNPGGVVGGDALKIWLLNKSKINKSEVLRSVLISRVLTIISFLVMAFIMILMYNFFAAQKIASIVLLVLACFIGSLIVMMIYLLISRKMYIQKLFSWISKLWRWNSLDKLSDEINTINLAIASYYKMYKRALLIGLVLFIIHWIFGALEFYVILYLLEVPIRLVDTLFLEFGTSFIRSLVAFVPGQVGIEEYSNKYFLGVVNVKDEGVWITVSIVRRIRQLFWIGLSVFYYLVFIKKPKSISNNLTKLEYENSLH